MGRLLRFALLPLMLLRAPAIGQRVTTVPHGIVVRCDSATVRLLVIDSRAIQVTAFPGLPVDLPPGLVVRKQPAPVSWKTGGDSATVTLRTDSLLVTVDVRSGAVGFFRRDGTVLVREKNPGRVWSPAIVSGERTVHLRQTFTLTPDEAIYGLGQFEDGVMNWRGKSVTLIQNNRHVCVPFLASTRGYGIFWDNYSHTEFSDNDDGMTFWSEVGDAVDYYFFFGGDMAGALAEFRDATGRAPMFPRWALGYWQSKERYESRTELLATAAEYRRRRIPIDNIVQDWLYWGKLGWNAMAFDPEFFPDPVGMIDSLHRVYHLQVMLSIWPQVDSATAVFRELDSAGLLFPTPVWNGGKTYDAYSPAARSIYWKHLKNLYDLGVDAWWVDATEPDWKWCDSLAEEKEGIVRNGRTALGSSSRYLNTYALMTTKGIYENQRAANPARRVVMLTRSAFAGQQRNSAAVWSGDISSNWQTFRNQIAGGVNISVAGIPYWNSDIGGFLPKEYGGEYPLGPRDPAYRELYVRWFQFGAFCPVFRAHGTDFPREVWRFGEPGTDAYDALVKFIRLRYRMLPYLYSTAWQVTSRHSTFMRPLAMDFPGDRNVRDINREYMFGPSLLVAPVTEEMYAPRLPGVTIAPEFFRTKNGEQGLVASYFSGMKCDTLVCVRRDSMLAMNWTNVGAPCVGKKNFSVRWEGRIRAPESGRYDFEIISDDGVNLWVDGRQLMDEMYPGGRQMNVGECVLKRGKWYDIRVEYYQERDNAEICLTWRTPSMLAAYRIRKDVRSFPVYLPEGTDWYNFWTGELVHGGTEVRVPAPLDVMPLFVKQGSIIPLGPEMQYATEKNADPVEVRIYPGADAEYEFYEDENDGYGYEKGAYSVIPIRWIGKDRTLVLGSRKGTFPGMIPTRTFHCVLVRPGHGIGGDAQSSPDAVVSYRGDEIRIRMEKQEGR